MFNSFKRYKRQRKAKATTSSSGPVCSLDPVKQLENIYAKLCTDDGGNQEWKAEVFQSVRILVLGRSGSGKTTLIRLIVGDIDGPQVVTKGTAGVQDINKEYIVYPGSGSSFRLIIHDSNGADVTGEQRVHTIKDFLKEHQNSSDFSQHVHLVWYVVSSVDARCLDDAGIMKVVSDNGIPLLLVMTFDDVAGLLPLESRMVTDDIVDTLLHGVKDKENVKKNMVRVGNRGVTMHEGRAVIDHSNNNKEALRLVSQRTQKLMASKLRYAWVVFQAVDMHAKLDASAALIDSYGRRAFFTSLPRLIPFADPLRLAIIFYRSFYCLCEIWRVPDPLKNALRKTLLYREGLANHVLGNICQDIVFVGSLGASVTATVLTGGLALPSVIVVLATSGFINARTVPILIKTFALQVLATILYVKCTQPDARTKVEWDPNVRENDYIQHCETFSHNNHYDKALRDFAIQHSTLRTALRHKKAKGLIKSKVVELFDQLHGTRQGSLYKFLESEQSGSEQSTILETQVTAEEEGDDGNGDDYGGGDDGDEVEYELDVQYE